MESLVYGGIHQCNTSLNQCNVTHEDVTRYFPKWWMDRTCIIWNHLGRVELVHSKSLSYSLWMLCRTYSISALSKLIPKTTSQWASDIQNFRRLQWNPDTFRVWFFHIFRFIWKAKMKLKVVLFPKAQLCEKSDLAVPELRKSLFAHSFNNLLLSLQRLFQRENCCWILTEIS